VTRAANQIAVLVTCHNRLSATETCLESLRVAAESAGTAVRLVVVDDGSNDGTWEMLQAETDPDVDRVLRGSGSLYWAGGMRLAMLEGAQVIASASHVMLLNDDTILYPDALFSLMTSSADVPAVTVGTVVDSTTGLRTYGGLRSRDNLRRLSLVPVEQVDGAACDTMNANAVLLTRAAYEQLGPFDAHFTHSLADIDYGFRALRAGFPPTLGRSVVGTCPRNDLSGSWTNPRLPRRERLSLLETPKGLPRAEWRYFARKHGGALGALYGLSPYVKILTGR
jgi:GT2 family glycosyltransferase